MKKQIITILAILLAMTISAHAEEPMSSDLQELSRLLRKGATPNVKLEISEKKRVEELLVIILPGKETIGKDKEWIVKYYDLDEGDFFQVDLKKKGDQSLERFIWFHILYKLEKPNFYGSEDFEGYSGLGMKDAHYFILVGNVEIRAVADADEYKNDKKIKGMLKAFKLKQIEKL